MVELKRKKKKEYQWERLKRRWHKLVVDNIGKVGIVNKDSVLIALFLVLRINLTDQATR